MPDWHFVTNRLITLTNSTKIKTKNHTSTRIYPTRKSKFLSRNQKKRINPIQPKEKQCTFACLERRKQHIKDVDSNI